METQSRSKPFRILSLDGGGTFALIQARAGRPLSRRERAPGAQPFSILSRPVRAAPSSRRR